MPINKHEKPCKDFLEASGSMVLNGTWADTDICLSCEWSKSDHPQQCEHCICLPGNDGAIFGPCAEHAAWSPRRACVQVAQCDCICHAKPEKKRTGNARINLRPTKRRRPLVLPPPPKVNHLQEWEEITYKQ